MAVKKKMMSPSLLRSEWCTNSSSKNISEVAREKKTKQNYRQQSMLIFR